MFPSLSDKTKSFIAVSAVLAVAICNVVFGMNWVAERPPARPLAAVTGVAEPPMLVSPPLQAAHPAPPAVAGSPPLKGNTAAPARGAPRPNAAAQTNAPAAPKISTSQPDTAIIIMNEPVAPATAEVLPICDVAACAAAYRTFTASDCTYMPSAGVRRLCTKGTPRPNAAAQTNAPAAPKLGTSQPDAEIKILNEPAAPATAEALPKCDIAACAAAYHSFTASDCTYMPSDGVRRLCTKGTPPQ